MRKRKLQVAFDINFNVWGMVTATKDYKLAWQLNQNFNIQLVREEDLVISFVLKKNIVVSHFKYETEYTTIRLIKNRGIDFNEAKYLIPELNRFDYFILIYGQDFFMKENKIEMLLKSVTGVDFILKVDTNKLKSRDNLIF